MQTSSIAAGTLVALGAAMQPGTGVRLGGGATLDNARVAVEDAALEPDDALPGLRVTAEAKVQGQTGVEMEALTAVSVACLTVYDMVKAADRFMRIEGIRLLAKEGGRSGSWLAEDAV